MNRKLLIGIGIGVVVLLLGLVVLAAAGKKKDEKKTQLSNEKITLTYWRPFDDKDDFQILIDAYQKEHSNVKIEYRKLTIAEYEKTLIDALAAGKGPDLFAVHNDWMPRYFDKIVPIAEDQMSIDDYNRAFFKVAADDNIKDNRIYGIPYSIDTLALYLNPELLRTAELSEPPKTWDELVGKPGDPAKPGILAKLNNRQGNSFNKSAIALGNTNVNRSADILALMMLQQRTDMVSADKEKALFNLTKQVEGVSPDPHLGTEAVKFYTSFADPRSQNYSWNAALGDSVKAFADGRTAMMLNYAYQIPNLQRLNPNLNYNIVAVPQIGGTDPVNYASYWTESVSKSSAHANEAWDFIKYVADREHLATYLEATKNVSSRKDVTSVAASELTVFYQQNESAVSWYKGDNKKADQIFIDLINQVLGGEDPQRAIDTAANRETETLQSLKGPPQ